MEYLGTIGLLSVTGIISNIMTGSDKISKLMALYSLGSEETDEVNKVISELDIQNKIQGLKIFLEEVKINDKSPQSLIHSLDQILQSINEIQNELSDIEYRRKYNLNKWFYIPPYKFTNSLNRLRNHMNKLANRERLLYTSISIRSFLMNNGEKTTIPTVEDIEVKKGLKLFNKK